MHPSNNDAKTDTNVHNKLQMRQTNTPPTISDSSQPSSPSGSILLVIDDTSNSEDETINNNNNINNNNHTNNIPIKLMPTSTAQMPHIQIRTTSPPSTHDTVNDSVNQQRRRNSSIAKLLGGRPLRNQQYEEIHQQILDSQSAQNTLNNNDNGTDSGIPRARSSITRTLLMNAERTNSMTKLPPKPPVPSAPPFTKDFDYLIRRELDKVESEHGSSTLERNNSVPKVIQNLNSSSNTNAQTPIQSKLKRKRPVSKSPSTVSNIPPFSLHNPFEIESSTTNPIPSVNHSQNKHPQFDSSKRPRYQNPPQYHTPINNSSSSANQSSYVYPNQNMNSTVFNQFNVHQDQTSSCNYPHYPSSIKLSSSATQLSSSSTNNIPGTSTRKAKSMPVRADNYERPRQRSYSNLLDSTIETSPKPTVPLKKRLLDAYNNEQHPTSSL